MGNHHILDELTRRVLPAEGERMRPRSARIELERPKRRMPQILAQYARLRVGQHVFRPADRVGRNRNAARQRFEQHETERIGKAWKDKDIGRGVGLGQTLAFARAREHGVRIKPLELFGLRTSTDQDLAAWQIEIEKGLDILLDGDAADIKKDRAFAEEARLARLEQIGVYAARPGHEPLEAARLKRRGDRRRCHESAPRAVMEAPLQRVAPALGHGQTGGDIFGKIRENACGSSW